jgi:hypothetical protein
MAPTNSTARRVGELNTSDIVNSDMSGGEGICPNNEPSGSSGPGESLRWTKRDVIPGFDIITRPAIRD